MNCELKPSRKEKKRIESIRPNESSNCAELAPRQWQYRTGDQDKKEISLEKRRWTKEKTDDLSDGWHLDKLKVVTGGGRGDVWGRR